MMHNTPRSIACAIAITAAATAGAGCATTTTTSQGWGNQQPPYYPGGVGRTGHVEWIQETVERQQGDPVAGAVAGAVIGGLIGHALSGGRGDGTVFGAAQGALIGADASAGYAERRTYQIIVRFDDGNVGSFLYEGYPPFVVGQPVQETQQGLVPP
jgi:outer membrane lipoprotein SlyB